MNQYCKLNGELYLILPKTNNFAPHLTAVQKLDSYQNPIPYVIGTYETKLLEIIE